MLNTAFVWIVKLREGSRFVRGNTILLLETVIFWRFSEKFDYPNIAKHSLYAMNVLNSHYLNKCLRT
jgi:hypothetical protein